jgi:ubiquinone/menaquinone biosynthesis C-methylase UbiE
MMSQVDFYDNFYQSTSSEVQMKVRRETYGEYIGQNSFITVDEYRAWSPLLNVKPDQYVLEIACGSGGPAVFLAQLLNCRLVGVDVNENALATAKQLVEAAGLQTRVQFQYADANQQLPFEDETFDGLVCFDAINHLADRAQVLQEWHRLLKPVTRILYTDPIIVTGSMSNAEMSTRSSIGFYVFTPAGENEKLLEQNGFRLIHREDTTDVITQLEKRMLDARVQYQEQLIQLEGKELYENMQNFYTVAYRLVRERRLSRIAYIAEKVPVS